MASARKSTAGKRVSRKCGIIDCMRTCGRKGQTMVEYVLAVAALLVVATVMGFLVTAAQKSAHRSEALVGADCP